MKTFAILFLFAFVSCEGSFFGRSSSSGHGANSGGDAKNTGGATAGNTAGGVNAGNNSGVTASGITGGANAGSTNGGIGEGSSGTITNLSNLTITITNAGAPEVDQFQALLKGGSAGWTTLTWTDGSKTYPNLCNANGISQIAFQGHHRTCNFTVGVTGDTQIQVASGIAASFIVWEHCPGKQEHPATVTVQCAGPGVTIVTP